MKNKLIKPAVMVVPWSESGMSNTFPQIIAEVTAEEQMVEYMLGRSGPETKVNEGLQKCLYESLKKLILVDRMTSIIIDDLYDKYDEYGLYGKNYYQAIKEDANRLKEITLKNMCNCCTEIPQDDNDFTKRFKKVEHYYSKQIDSLFKLYHTHYVHLCENAGIEVKEFNAEEA